MVVQVDASVQTDNDILTDEAPQFAARPPNSTKAQLLEGQDFTDVDVHVLTTPDEVSAWRPPGDRRFVATCQFHYLGYTS